MERPVPGLGPRLWAPRRGAAAGGGAGADGAARAGEPRRPELRGAARGEPARARAQRGHRRGQPALSGAGDAQHPLRLLPAAARAAGRQPAGGVARGQRPCLLLLRPYCSGPFDRRWAELERSVGDLRVAGRGRRRRSRGPGAGRRRHPVDGGLEPRPGAAGGRATRSPPLTRCTRRTTAAPGSPCRRSATTSTRRRRSWRCQTASCFGAAACRHRPRRG